MNILCYLLKNTYSNKLDLTTEVNSNVKDPLGFIRHPPAFTLSSYTQTDCQRFSILATSTDFFSAIVSLKCQSRVRLCLFSIAKPNNPFDMSFRNLEVLLK